MPYGAEGELNTVLNLVTEIVGKCRAEKGNLFYKVHQSSSDENTLIFFEKYKNEAAVEEHRNSDHYKILVLEKIVPLLDDRQVSLPTELVFK